MRTVTFDRHGMTNDCPRGIPVGCDECILCEFFEGSEGFEAQCSYSSNYNEDDYRAER